VISNKRHQSAGNTFEADVVSAQDYYAGGSLMPGRSFSLNGSSYKYGFNGKENDNEVKGEGNQQDYGMRIYDPRLQRFLSVDPITKEYPELTPYQFASNRPIDGVDLDGLEYLKSDEARVQFKYGRLELKVSNFLWVNQNAWTNANMDPNNWTYTNGVRDIGINKTIANVNFMGPQFEDASAKDIPELPSSIMSQEEAGVKSQAYNRAGRREIARKGSAVSVKGSQGKLAKGAVLLDFAMYGLEQYQNIAWIYDSGKVQDHTGMAGMAVQNVSQALNDGLIPKKFQNKKDLSVIMNVVLQGVNNSGNKDLYDIGMSIFNKYKPKVEKVTVPSGLDNNGSRSYTVPQVQNGSN
jgi:RHS repeat-associated protein